MLRFFENRIDPYPETASQAAPAHLGAFIWQCTQGSRFYFLLMVIFSSLYGAFEALLFAVMGHVADWMQEKALWSDYGSFLILFACMMLASIVVVALNSIIKHQILMGNFPMRLRWIFHRQILDQSMSFFQNEFSGRVSAKVMQTALAVRDLCMGIGDVMSYVLVNFITVIAVVTSFDWRFLPPFLLWLTFYIVAVRWFVPRLSKSSESQASARALMTGRITDAYTNISTVKLFSHAGREAEYAKSAMLDFQKTVYRQMRLISGLDIVHQILSAMLLLSVAGIGLWLLSQEKVGFGGVTAVFALALRVTGMSQWVMWTVATLFENVGTIRDGMGTLSKVSAVVDKPGAKALQVKQGEVIFKNVCFNYARHDDKPIIEGFNLTIRPGERIGLVGRSGAGKSTLVNLLLRFYDVNSGEITIDGQNIADVTQDSLRENIGMVTQDTSLLHRSIRENIKYGRLDATDEQMIQAAKHAQAHDFIVQLRDDFGNSSYDVEVGERGVKLSGGQRQRIAIARVMLKDAPILLLDEATSALDSEVELAIQDSLYSLMKGKTVVAIAHRLSTIAAMDRLIVMDKGRIVEEGTHAELLAKGGVYSQLWAHQSGGFLPQ